MIRRPLQQIFSLTRTTLSYTTRTNLNQITCSYWSCVNSSGFISIGNLPNQSASILRNKSVNMVPIVQNRPILAVCTPFLESVRTKTYYSYRRGAPKTVKAVLKRFKRLDWGAWIRTKAGRKKYLWKKSNARKYRLRQHVFCNSQQSKLLDKMVTGYWKKKRHYVNDPYEPYQKRVNMPNMFPEKPPFVP